MKHPLGCQRIASRTYFTIYAPYAKIVRLTFFDHCEDKIPKEIVPMRAIGEGYWEYSDIKTFHDMYYAYMIDDKKIFIPDPYSYSVSNVNDFNQEAKTYIHHSHFDWENDRFTAPKDPRDIVMYECHIRDLTVHPSADTSFPGTYTGVKDKIDYLLDLGVNAVEFMPLMKYANIEPPFQEKAGEVFNYWNPYAYNYWGYMTSFFFAPENTYSEKGQRTKNTWCDPRGAEIEELKSLIKALHNAGISVIMDVVFNHISQYNQNPLRTIAEDQYILPHNNTSGCGNDTRSESPIMRQLIVNSVEYWMKEFHIDGFRFDLAGVLDDETLNAVIKTAYRINPHAIIVGEPWGKRYFPQQMSDMGWGIWNDVFRNGVKGENPTDRRGYIFGRWDNDLHPDNFLKLLTGSLQQDGGLVKNSKYTLNYLESHDGYTLGDFIRIAVRKPGKTVISEHDIHVKLSKEEEKYHRLAAFILACSQGIMMIHAGQEYARSKVIAPVPGIIEARVGELDKDSYAKDNETNYMNFQDVKTNRSLYNYYQQLLCLRKIFPELRAAERKHIYTLHAKGSEFGLGYYVNSPFRHCVVLINTSADKTAKFSLPESKWDVYATLEYASCESREEHISGTIILEPRSVRLLIKKK